MTEELPFPPGGAPPIEPAPERVVISKFRSLLDTRVQEQIETTWDAWLAHLSANPQNSYAGQMEHSGWSPVRYDPPKRSKENAREAYALVLDYDKNADWERVAAVWNGSQFLIHTTKSHGEKGNRYRVVLPLERAVTAEEYGKLWDWANKQHPIDPQAKDISRFWYDPSTPPGGWRAEIFTGKRLAPDPVLALAPEPPTLRIVHPMTPVSRDLRVERAQRYLAKIPGAISGSGGHTQTFNAVAHVMIGFDLDDETAFDLIAADYNPRCSPPWSEKELRHKVQSVRKTCSRPLGYLLEERPRIHNTQDAADHAPPVPEELDVDWTTLLLTKKDRSVKRAYHNVAVFVRHFPEYRGKWSLDEMTDTPWYAGEPMAPSFVHEVRAHADRRLGFTPAVADVEAAIVAAAQDRPFHPIRQYLRSLDWDGIPRLDAMARDYLGSDSPLHAEMVRRWMIGAAARALQPGCKLDTALMLVGAQGIGKSTFFQILGGPWHADSFVDITNKDSFVQIHAAWIYELAELENVVTGRAESRLKAWLTSTHDMFRAPYQRTAERRARGCIICGTTNRQQFLTDDTGSRRFWIVPVHQQIDRALLAEMRDQLWAEAVCAAEAGEPWWLSEASEAARELANRDHQEDDVWQDLIAEWLSTPAIKETTVSRLLSDALKVEYAKQDRWAQMRVSRALKQLGWQRVRGSGMPRRWVYLRPEVEDVR